jgi:glucose/mannose transport system permease protein
MPVAGTPPQRPPGDPDVLRNLSAKIAALPMIATALVIFVGCTLWTVMYSFTNSKLLPNTNFVGLISMNASGRPAAG